MRDAPGHHPQGGEFLALVEALLERPSLGQVPPDRDDAAHLAGIVTDRGTGPIDRDRPAGTSREIQLPELNYVAPSQLPNDRRHVLPLSRLAQIGQRPSP